MTQFGFYFNQDECIGCRSCQIACNDRNNLEAGKTIRTVKSYETGTYPKAVLYHYAATCNHCENPACAAACPTGATQKADDDGTVFRDASLCIGCGACTFACPYGHPVLLDEGISGRCDGCRSFRDNGKNPVCVDACVMRALEWGNIKELRAAHPEGVCDLPILPSSETTGPSLVVKPFDAALNEDFSPFII